MYRLLHVQYPLGSVTEMGRPKRPHTFRLRAWSGDRARLNAAPRRPHRRPPGDIYILTPLNIFACRSAAQPLRCSAASPLVLLHAAARTAEPARAAPPLAPPLARVRVRVRVRERVWSGARCSAAPLLRCSAATPRSPPALLLCRRTRRRARPCLSAARAAVAAAPATWSEHVSARRK